MSTRSHAGMLAVALGALLACACSKTENTAEVAAAGTSAAVPSGAAANAPADSGLLLDGSNRAALRRLVLYDSGIKPIASQIVWDKRVVALGRDATADAIQYLSDDGTLAILDSGVKGVADIAPGRILWLWNLQISEVTQSMQLADRLLLRLKPVLLTEAMQQADIRLVAPISLKLAIPARGIARARPAVAAPTDHRAPGRVGFLRIANSAAAPAPDTGEPQPANADYDPLAKRFTGTANKFSYTLGFAPRGPGAVITLEARYGDTGDQTVDNSNDTREKTDEAARAARAREREVAEALSRQRQLVDEKKLALNEWVMRELELPPFPYVAAEKARLEAALRATQDELEKIEAERLAAQREAESLGAKAGAYAAAALWDIVSDNVDIRLRSAAQIDDFNLEFLLGIQDHKMTSLETVLQNLKGKATMEIVARLGQPGQQNIKVPVAHIPAFWTIPVPVAGLPLVIQVATDFTVTVSLTAKNAVLTTAGSFEFSGSAGFGQKGDSGYNKSDVRATKPAIAHYKGMSLGVSAYVLGVQLPRLGVGLGLFGVSAVGYADLVHVITFTNGAAAAIGLAAPPCKRISYSVVSHVGVQTDLLPFKFSGSGAVANALSPQMEIHKWENILTDPPIRACDL